MKKIIIVGGGIAGLAAGIYGLKAGMAAEIYEKNPVAGGSCSGWYRGDYFIDNCIHWLTGTKPDTPQYGIWQEQVSSTTNTPQNYFQMFFQCHQAEYCQYSKVYYLH